jgi:hypothetical protein
MPQLSAEAQELSAVESRSALPLGWLRAFSIDVETNPADGDRIFKLGAVRSLRQTEQRRRSHGLQAQRAHQSLSLRCVSRRSVQAWSYSAM